nr:unnamed protein product [Digitaria exilis]
MSEGAVAARGQLRAAVQACSIGQRQHGWQAAQGNGIDGGDVWRAVVHKATTKKLKKRKKGKDDNDFYAVAECGSEVQILVQQEDLQGGVHTSDGVADEKNNLNALELEDVEVAGDGAQRLDDLGLEDSLSTLFTRSGRKSRQVPEKDAEGVEVSCSHDDEVVDKGSALAPDTASKGPKRRRRRTKEEMKNAAMQDRKASLPRKAKANGSKSTGHYKVRPHQTLRGLSSISPDLENKSVGKEKAADDGLCRRSLGEALLQDVEASKVLKDGSRNPSNGFKPCSGKLTENISCTAANMMNVGVSYAHTCSQALGKDSSDDVDCSQGKSPTSIIRRKTGLKPKQVPQKPAQQKDALSSGDSKPAETTENIEPNANMLTEGNLDQLSVLGAKDSFSLHDLAAPANDVNMADLAAPLDYEGMENASKVKRITRSSKKRKHVDMAYEGDVDWETLMQEQGLFSNPSAGFVDQSVKSKDKMKTSEVYEGRGDNGVAAVRAGLKAKAVTPIEKIKFKEVLKQKGGLLEYLECRNMILSRWSKDVKHLLDLAEFGVSVVPLKDELPRQALIRDVYLFLDQNGYINSGIASDKVATEHDAPEVVEVPELNESHQMESFSIQESSNDKDCPTVECDALELLPHLKSEEQPAEEKNLGMSTEVTGDKVPDALDEDLEAEYNGLLDEMALLFAQNGDSAIGLSLEDGLEYALRKHRAPQHMDSIEQDDNLKSMTNAEAMDISRSASTEKEIAHCGRDDKVDVLSPLERRLMNWHFAHLEYGCAAPLKSVSLPYWNQDDVYGGFGGPHCMIKGGYDTVLRSLAKGLDIRLNHVVTDILYGPEELGASCKDGKRVKVSTSNGNEFIGDAVLITIPLGCLKAQTIKFSPSLPDWKLSSINRLGFGVLNKIVLEFPEVFWDDTVDYFGATAEETDLRGRCFMFWNLRKTVGAPVLIALLVGKAAIDGQSISSDVHVNNAMVVLRKLFRDASVPDPVASVVTNWGLDPFSRGAYTYVAVGASGRDYDILGRPVANCLFFAGEATCKEHPDTVGGAILSGLREAVRIIDLVNTGNDYIAEVEALQTYQMQSDSERNEVRDMSNRLEACELSTALSKNSSDAMYPIVSKESLLQEMFFSAKTTSGRLHLAKELLKLPTDVLKSFAGSKEGLSTLNSWILDSLGKNATQLLRHCLRLLVLVSTDLVAVRLSVEHGIPMSEEEAAVFAAAEAARAAAIAAAQAYASVEAEISVPRELPKIPSFHTFAMRDHHADESDTRKKTLTDNFGRLECISENGSKDDKAKNSPDNANCADVDSMKMSGDNGTQRSHSSEKACLANVRDHNTDLGILDGRAWVDTDTICIDGVKDPLAIERWQAQAMEADKEFYSRIRIPDEEDSTGPKQACRSSASQGVDSKPASERQSRGVEHIKQGLVNFIASLLMPLYRGKKIDRDGYKTIMRKAVNKLEMPSAGLNFTPLLTWIQDAKSIHDWFGMYTEVGAASGMNGSNFDHSEVILEQQEGTLDHNAATTVQAVVRCLLGVVDTGGLMEHLKWEALVLNEQASNYCSAS